MTPVPFGSLPFIVRLATMLSILMTWVGVEEFGIDRYHLDVYLPFYRVGAFCVYDFAMLTGLAVLWVRLSRGTNGPPA